MQQGLPRPPAHDRVGDRLLHAAAQRLGASCDLAEMGRQPAFDLGLDLARQDGRGALRADGDDDRIAVDDGGHDEVALRGTVDDVGRQAAGAAGGGDAGVELGVVTGGEDQRRAVEVGLGEGVTLDDNRRNGSGGDVLADVGGNDPQARRRLGEQPQLLQCLLAAADDEHVAAVEIEEDREVPQRRTFRFLRAEHHDRLG